jgi:hypothetical protein
MMEAVSTSEMMVNFYKTTWHNDSEGCHLLSQPIHKSHFKKQCDKLLDVRSGSDFTVLHATNTVHPFCKMAEALSNRTYPETCGWQYSGRNNISRQWQKCML